jgi:hypothetical protein
MAARTLVVASLLLSIVAPARAEFCFLDSQRDGTPVIYELGGPVCGGGNRLVFTRRYGPDRVSEKFETFMTESWPGFMGADEKCKSAERGARYMVDCPGSIILGRTVLSGHQVWAFTASCSTFRSRFTAKRSELIAKDGKENTSSEKAMEAINAGESSMSELVGKLIELGQNPPKKACGEQ